MRVTGPGSSVAVIPPRHGRATQSESIAVEAAWQAAPAQADTTAAFGTRRYPFLRAEPVGRAERGRPGTGETQDRPTQAQPQTPFLAQFIAQERLGDGLAISKAEDGTSAYRRRADAPLVAIRAGANIDVAA